MAVGPLPAASGPVDAVLGSAPPCGLNSDEIVGCGCAPIPLCDPTPMPLGSDIDLTRRADTTSTS
jgi:hypothetical protein